MPGPVKRLSALDGLRTLAIALVFAHHIDQRALPGGFIGVDVFFVISGFIITHLLLREHEQNGAISLGRFYVRRLLRLYPAFLLMVLITAPIAAIDQIGKPAEDSLFALTYLTDFWANYQGGLSLLLHTWSLAVEEQFYLIWPAILIFALRRRWRIQQVITPLILISLVITFAVYEAHIGRLHNIQYLPTSHVAELGSGILLAVWLREGLPAAARILATEGAALLALVALVVCEFVLNNYWWSFPAVTLACWPLVAHVVTNESSGLTRFFSQRALVWMGRRSYGFYIWHYPIILLLDRSVSSSWLVAAVALPLTLMATVLSWRLVEQPVLRYKDARWHAPAKSEIGAATPSVGAT